MDLLDDVDRVAQRCALHEHRGDGADEEHGGTGNEDGPEGVAERGPGNLFDRVWQCGKVKGACGTCRDFWDLTEAFDHVTVRCRVVGGPEDLEADCAAQVAEEGDG